jgi:hypothetical protein
MSVKVTWRQVLTWRLRRQYVDPLCDADVGEIASRLCGIQAQVASAAEMAIGLRQKSPQPQDIKRGLADGTLVKTWATRGTLHLFQSSDVANYLSLLAAAQIWIKPTWERAFGASAKQVEQLTEAVAAILHGQVLTRDELVQALVADGRFTAMESHLRSGWGSLLKPLAWQGALCFGPNRGNSVTFTSPLSLLPSWKGVPEPAEAAPTVIAAYLGAYGPSTPEVFDAWLTRNSHKKTTLRRWFGDMGERLVEVDVEGQAGLMLSEYLDELVDTKPSDSVRLLGAFDQYILGPGTGDARILAGEHRAKVSRPAGWISPIVVVGGRIVGVWEIDGGHLSVSMFAGEPAPSAKALKALKAEAARVAAVSGAGTLSVRLG